MADGGRLRCALGLTRSMVSLFSRSLATDYTHFTDFPERCPGQFVVEPERSVRVLARDVLAQWIIQPAPSNAQSLSHRHARGRGHPSGVRAPFHRHARERGHPSGVRAPCSPSCPRTWASIRRACTCHRHARDVGIHPARTTSPSCPRTWASIRRACTPSPSCPRTWASIRRGAPLHRHARGHGHPSGALALTAPLTLCYPSPKQENHGWLTFNILQSHSIRYTSRRTPPCQTTTIQPSWPTMQPS